jgi:hypothetical protein
MGLTMILSRTAIAAALLARGLASAADPVAPPVHDCRWRVQPVVVDGRVDEAEWRGAQWVDGFWGLDAASAERTRTRAALLWDDAGLWFAAVMQDTDLYAVVTQHDGNTWDDDVFELFLKPPGGFADLRRTGRPYYEFEVNARNTTFDLLFEGNGERKRDFLAGLAREAFQWKTAVQVAGTLNDGAAGDSAWSVEGFLPWSDFAPTGGRPHTGAAWTGIFARYDFPSSGKGPRISASAPMTAEQGFHDPARWMTIRFVAAVP